MACKFCHMPNGGHDDECPYMENSDAPEERSRLESALREHRGVAPFWPSYGSSGGYCICGTTTERWEGRRRTVQRIAEVILEEEGALDQARLNAISKELEGFL